MPAAVLVMLLSVVVALRKGNTRQELVAFEVASERSLAVKPQSMNISHEAAYIVATLEMQMTPRCEGPLMAETSTTSIEAAYLPRLHRCLPSRVS